MGFTTPCFIRKNTPELRENLKAFGYIDCSTVDDRYTAIFVDAERGEFFTEYLSNITEDELAIDCYENDNLFLAIAALRDDTDRGQFFVTEARLGSINCPDSIIEKGSFIICCTDKWEIPKNQWDSMGIPSHKASVLELIEYFKKQ